MLVTDKGFPRLFLTDDLYHPGFLPTEGNLISDDLILDRVPQRGIQDHLNLLPLDESHLYQPFPEAAMSMDTDNNTFFSCIKVCKSHICRIFLRLQKYTESALRSILIYWDFSFILSLKR